jgi:uncharacterized protein YutE (UPF0331/DUF86 family)
MLPNGFVVNSANLDSADVKAIMASSRSIPLSEEEKHYLDELYYSYEYAISLIGVAVDKLGSKLKDADAELYNDMIDALDRANGILNISTEELGRGYMFEVKEE